jgi:hypothetical protein
MRFIGLKVGVALLAAALATVAQAQTSGPSGGINSGSPRSSSPASGSPNPGSMRNEPNAPAPNTPQGAVVPPPQYPSAAQGTTMNTGPDRALSTPEDRAKCAPYTGMTQADCMADARKQREPRGRM